MCPCGPEMGRSASGGSSRREKREREMAGTVNGTADPASGPAVEAEKGLDTDPSPMDVASGLVPPSGTGCGPTVGAETGPDTDLGPVPAPGTASFPATDADTGPDTDPGPSSSTDASPRPVPGAVPVPEPFPDPLTDPDVESLPRGRFRCRLCQISAANRPSLADHLRGKKHRRLRELRAQRRAQERRSLFVTGFPRGTGTEELARYFRTYGDVETVVMDKEKGVYAIVELREAGGRDRALAEPRHDLNGHRLRVRPREEKGFVYCPPAAPPGKGSPSRETLGPARLEQELLQAADVTSQMSLLVELLELSEAERRVRTLLVTLFQEVFTEFFPGCSVVPFGSSVNGFSSHGCDLDLLLDLEPPQSLSGTPPPSSPPPPPESLLSDTDLGTAPQLLDLVTSVLRRCVPGVHRVRPVLAARRPVVKFSHKQSGLAGDISIDNRLALFNTRFLLFCAQTDPRVRPLVYAVRLWAKQQGLAGNPSGGGPLLNNYALTLLVLFFLQTRDPPVLPPVTRLRDMAGDEDRAVVAGWDCTFPRDPAVLEPSANTESPCSLLAQFFHFWGDFDFGGHLISPREGRVLPLPSPHPLPPGFKVGPLNLQDPFELNHNVGGNVPPKTVALLAHRCREAAKYCRSLQYLQKSPKNRIWGLIRLFRAGPGDVADVTDGVFLIFIPWGGHPGPGFGDVCGAVVYVLRDVLKCGCVTQGGSPGVPPEESGVPLAATGDKRHRPEVINGCDGLPPPGKKRRLDVTEEVTSWSCVLRHRVWEGRRKVRRWLCRGGDTRDPLPGDSRDLPSHGDSLELERKVSEVIVGRGDTEGRGDIVGRGDTVARGDVVGHGDIKGQGDTMARGDVVAQGDIVGRGDAMARGDVVGQGDTVARGDMGTQGDTEGRGDIKGQGDTEGQGDTMARGDIVARGGMETRGDTAGRGDVVARGDIQGEGDAVGRGDVEGQGDMEGRGDTVTRGDTGGHGDAGGTPQPLLRFRVTARPTPTQVLLHFFPSPTPPTPLFRDFFHFLESFLPLAVKQRLEGGARGGPAPQNGEGEVSIP